MNAVILLAEGFETVEALQTADVLLRSKRFGKVTLCAIEGDPFVYSSQRILIRADATLDSLDFKDYDLIILPGGKLGTENLKSSERVASLIESFLRQGKDVHAICAAPSILASRGYLDGLDYTCFPGFQCGKGNYLDQGVVETPHIITGHSMGYTLDFARTIVAHYFGKEAVLAIEPGIMGLA